MDAPEYPKDSRETGWYYKQLLYQHDCALYWDLNANRFFYMSNIIFDIEIYDQFLVIDGRRIDFSKLHNLKMDISFTEKEFEETDKKGKDATVEIRFTYLGKNFRIARVDKFYVAK